MIDNNSTSLQRPVRFDIPSRLPAELALTIYSHLSAGDLRQAQAVSRTWSALAGDPLLLAMVMPAYRQANLPPKADLTFPDSLHRAFVASARLDSNFARNRCTRSSISTTDNVSIRTVAGRGHYVYTSDDYTEIIWRAETMQPIYSTMMGGIITAAEFSADGSRFATVTPDAGLISIHHGVALGLQAHRVTDLLSASLDPLDTMEWSRDNRMLLVDHEDESLTVYNVDDAAAVAFRVVPNNGGCPEGRFTQDSKMLRVDYKNLDTEWYDLTVWPPILCEGRNSGGAIDHAWFGDVEPDGRRVAEVSSRTIGIAVREGLSDQRTTRILLGSFDGVSHAQFVSPSVFVAQVVEDGIERVMTWNFDPPRKPFSSAAESIPMPPVYTRKRPKLMEGGVANAS